MWAGWYCEMYWELMSPTPPGMPVYRWCGGGIMAWCGMKAGRWAWGGGGGWWRGECPPGWNSGCWGKTRTRRTPFSSMIWGGGNNSMGSRYQSCSQTDVNQKHWETPYEWLPVKCIQEAHRLEALNHLETSWEPEQDLWGRQEGTRSNTFPWDKGCFQLHTVIHGAYI